MCLSKYSNLEHLKEVAKNLYLSEDHGNINELCERELADLINTFYQAQECEVITSGEKRKHEVDTKRDIKKLRVLHKVSNILSALELLPNEVYEMILKPLSGEDQKNLRMTSKRLYEKTTLMAPIFKDWCFQASRGIPPDFVSDTKKKFKVHASRTCSATKPLIKRFANRISSIQIQMEGKLLKSLNMFVSDFIHLTSLDLEYVYFDNSSLLMLAPQLEHLRLESMKNPKFDISSVNKQSKSFTKLKALKLNVKFIDMKKILSKSCKTLEYLECDNFQQTDGLEDLNEELSSLKSLSVHIDCEEPIRNLLSKCVGSLITLKITDECATANLNNLVAQTMKITTLVLDVQINLSNISMLFSKCPFTQNLTLANYNKEVKDIVLKYLINLKLVHCSAECVTSILNQTSKSLKTLHLLMEDAGELANWEFPQIPKLDTVWIETVDDSFHSNELYQVLKLFPSDAKVETEKLEYRTVIRRVYDLT